MNSPTLQNKKILITRSAHQAIDWIEKLKKVGAEVITIPLISIVPPDDDYHALDESIKNLSSYDGLIFTSRNAVDSFFDRYRTISPQPFPTNLLITAVGPATAKKIRDKGKCNVISAREPNSFGVLKALSHHAPQGKRYLFPRARNGRDDVVYGLRAQGGIVEVVEAYRTRIPDETNKEWLIDLIDRDGIDIAFFASPSAVYNFLSIVGNERAKKFSMRKAVASIGPATESALKRRGIRTDLPTEYALRNILF